MTHFLGMKCAILARLSERGDINTLVEFRRLNREAVKVVFITPSVTCDS